MAETRQCSRRQADALWCGLVLLLASGLIFWRALGHPLDDQRLAVAAPFVLIGLGLLAALTGRAGRHRR
ncbi:hypothetical protein EDD41_0991 [Luteococcus japonicus]|uniref:Uncharacterized protein n=1 Tax=Luteococcus japonicus TaxID=33984 RepID=A0A3N1ZSX6_9ACTN|nr:hypothetical protein [Luteococcus japonicus]ROR53818.1 hypothetical protein EDD41_0991 [Luteococcus japonicus]